MSKKMVQVLTRDVPGFFFLPGTCLEHQSHLGVLGSLKHVDQMLESYGRKWRYFSSIAMIANTLRDLSQSLFSSWRSLFGDESAVAKVKALFPRCIAERWGSIDQTESRLLKANVASLAQAVSHMFQVYPQLNDAGVGDEAAHDKVDLLGADDRKAYQKKMGRWRRHTIETLHDPLFGGVILVLHEAKQPWIHLSNFLKKKLPLESDGHLFQLVCGKAKDMLSQFEDMLFEPLGNWAAVIITDAVLC